MSRLATTKLSSRGQVVIPESIREKMHLHAGDQFIVMAAKDIVILKMLTPPSEQELKKLIVAARQAASESGLSEQDVQDAIVKARKK